MKYSVQMKSLGFPTVVRVFCPVVFKIILSLVHVAFTKAVDVKVQGRNSYKLCRTCFCNNVQASKYRSVGYTLQDCHRIVEAHDKIFVRREK